MNAYRDPTWWSNSSSTAHAKAWLEAGWEVEGVNLKEGYAVFKKVRDVRLKKSSRRKLEITKPFIPRSKVPSKTKVSKLYARIKNMERNRAAERRQIRGFKAKPRH
jgi:hypothetical protein